MGPRGQAWARWSVHSAAGVSTLAALIEAVALATAPVLGAIADAVGPRKPWVLAFSALYVVGAAGLWGAAPGLADPTAILAFLAIALIGAEYTGVFTNAALSALGGREEIGHISGSGWALGYWGGLASLFSALRSRSEKTLRAMYRGGSASCTKRSWTDRSVSMCVANVLRHQPSLAASSALMSVRA